MSACATGPDDRSVPADKPDAPVIEGGSLPVGKTAYDVPAGALFVAASGGGDANPGSRDAPFRTIRAAVSRAESGATIVVRAGSYNEEIVIPEQKRLVLQAFPNEEVWLDGSRTVDNFVPAGRTFVADHWNAQFDPSPTYTWGEEDGTEAGWRFVDPLYPLAAHPDQVWIDDVPQHQVASQAELGEGNFYVDYSTRRLFIGSSPEGRTVRASTTAKALSIRSSGSTVRGLGIRRYSPSVPHMGAVTAEGSGIVLENLVIRDNATTGLWVGGADTTLTDVTVAANGMLGAAATYADRMTVTGLLAEGNNTERFRPAPVAGGFKITRSRSLTISDSTFADNRATGLWLDESVFDATISNSRMADNASHGVSAEISARISLVNNIITNNGSFGAKINDTSDVRVWNNTFSGNRRQLNVVQDERRGDNPDLPGHDPRDPEDPEMTWINGPVDIHNNIFAGTSEPGGCLLCVEDYSREFSAVQLQIHAAGNAYHRERDGMPFAPLIWAGEDGKSVTFESLKDFHRTTGQEPDTLEIIGASPLDPDTFAAPSLDGQAGHVALPLPADLAGLSRVPEGTRHLGAFVR
ncbi:right-handed parallel beta-helix repeat-containing protein [Arthrobacter zhangbolii]|uniref:Right-handed parallel beta-helix repeat-containing protein n=1 Tax=Arthrobacter zhangbolii TaxID=2886936 RepID=A0A9X1S9D7_9MICC|nr:MULTISPECIES: right-handed parallel beta-helix repeat-containing protein [Arthrobacter]MCC3272968.1 right-handed parallel beta-helix repeat-containing protein [Arthrobacter zhangbolii]MDN3905258.1 right-handed parallel beta-helix repeat-containing protein [Arthrobacter sp. YD2]UON93017.1 right-handed parallel beta-helix repeat-containing protein [Arthrobacter zhangbolii]